MPTNIHQRASPPEFPHQERTDALTWGTIFGLASIAVTLLFWMGSASHAGAPLVTVGSIGLGSLAASGLAAATAVSFSRRP